MKVGIAESDMRCCCFCPGLRRTMRQGSERHLVCIEDPFELSHDLGRTIDKISVVVSGPLQQT